MERDDLEGAEVRFKRVYEVDLRRRDGDGFVAKRELVDLLDLRDPAGISLPAEQGDRGLGKSFSFPLRSVESILPLPGGRLVVANDNNYPFDAGRHDDRIDGNEWIMVTAPPTCAGRRATIVGSPGPDTGFATFALRARVGKWGGGIAVFAAIRRPGCWRPRWPDDPR